MLSLGYWQLPIVSWLQSSLVQEIPADHVFTYGNEKMWNYISALAGKQPTSGNTIDPPEKVEYAKGVMQSLNSS